MFAQCNQQYQQAGRTAVSTNGLVWNGNAWVSAAGSQVANPASLVTKYTEYYHQWTARAKEYEQHAQRLPLNSPQRTEAQQHAEWATYYADQASRAAHHYHSHPHTPAPFELPPAPPLAAQQQQQQRSYTAVSTPSVTAKKTSRWSPHVASNTSAAKSPSAASSDGPPDGLKRYVHRCLEQCKTPEQAKAVERETERVIARALQNGSLHTTNWDETPLIPIPGAKRDFSSSSQGHCGRPEPSHSSKKQKLTLNDSYYGPPSGGGGGGQLSRNSGNDQGQGGYYGPGSSSFGTNTPSPTSPHSYYQPQQQHHQQSKYGQDFIAVPQFGNKNFKKSNKYVNPNSTKHNKSTMEDGFQRSSSALAKRASRFSGPGGNSDVRLGTAKGIDDRYMGKGVIGGSNKKLDEIDYEQMKVKGTCTLLEKKYLRLTAPPKPELVRPLKILQQHLKNLKEEWKSPTRRDYLWFCSEMKSMRQDLTVQHISNAFTVEAYEFHARIALQEGDLNEFNQAQTQLKLLYKKVEDSNALENQNEFVAYLLIYYVMLMLNKKYTGGSSDLLNLMLSLTLAQREDPAIRHALQVRASVAEVDYHKFFHLLSSCPNLGDKLMFLMVPTMRHWGLKRIIKAYRPSIEVLYVLKELGWSVDEAAEMEEGKKFLSSCGCVMSDDCTQIQAKDSAVRESDLQEKGSLI